MAYHKTALAFAMLSAALLSGCGDSTQHTLKVGAIAGLESQLVEEAARIAKEKFGLSVDVVTFTDFITPNIALTEKSIDLNAFQHRPYLESQVADRGYPLVAVANTFIYPMAGYSRKLTSLEALPDGAKIALPNDPSNLGRALLLLEKQRLITLRSGSGLKATLQDITENPKNLAFIEIEAAQLPRSLEDVDIAVINTVYSSLANLIPGRDGLFMEDKQSPYVNIIAARVENKQDPKVLQFIQAFQTLEVEKLAKTLFKDSVEKGW